MREVLEHLSDELRAKKKAIPEQLETIITRAYESVDSNLAYSLNNVFENEAEGSEVQDLKVKLHKVFRKMLVDWEAQWRFHATGEGHILGMDVSIPEKYEGWEDSEDGDSPGKLDEEDGEDDLMMYGWGMEM